MSNIVDFHPPLTKLSAIPDPNDPEGYLCNVPMVIRLAKDAGTAKGDAFYRAYQAAWHSLAGQPLSPEGREQAAFYAAAAKVGLRFRTLQPMPPEA